MTGFANIARDIDPSKWINVGEIEAVISDARGGSVVATRKGREYRTELTPRQVLEAIGAATP